LPVYLNNHVDDGQWGRRLKSVYAEVPCDRRYRHAVRTCQGKSFRKTREYRSLPCLIIACEIVEKCWRVGMSNRQLQRSLPVGER